MNKQEGPKTKYFVQWDTHARHMCTVLCSLMEHQSLVDLAICCGTNTIHAHKCVLAANSPYFREQLEKNIGTEQVIITGLDFAVVKSLIEFMYCGETNILDENLKYMIAAAKFFQIRGLQTLVSDHQELRYEAESISIPAPMFLPKKPKYPNAYRPLNNAPLSATYGPYKAQFQSDSYLHRKIKRKFVRSEAEKACAKEAAASRLALEALQKELASTTHTSSFLIEESCTETTVENFIPHSDETFIENVNHIDGVPLQIVNYEDLDGSILTADQMININKSECANNTLQFEPHGNANKDKLKRLLGTNLSGNIEIMYRTNEGEIVNVTADVLQNLSGDSLQYQIVDENGQIREIREFQSDEQNCSSANYETSQCVASLENPVILSCISDVKPLVNTQNENYVPSSNLKMLNSSQFSENNQYFEAVIDKPESTDKPATQTMDLYNHDTNEVHSCDTSAENVTTSKNDLINTSNSSSSSSEETLSNSTASAINNTCETELLETLSKSEETPGQTKEINSDDVNHFLNLEDAVGEKRMGNRCSEDKEAPGTLSEAKKKPNFLGIRKFRTMTAENNITDKCNLSDELNQEVSKWSKSQNICRILNIDLTGNSSLNTLVENSEAKDNENIGGGSKLKKIKFTQVPKPSASNLGMTPVDDEVQIIDDVETPETHLTRKTRSSSKTVEDHIDQSSSSECKEVDDCVSHIKYDKARRMMPSRKKKSI